MSPPLIRLLLAFLLGAAGQSTATGVRPLDPQAMRRLEARALRLVNDARRDADLPPVAAEPALNAVARDYAHAMASGVFVGHVSPDPGRRTTGKRLAAGGIADAEYGENVGRFGTSRERATWVELLDELSRRLFASDAHRPRILGKTWTHAGTGVAVGLAPADADSSVRVPSIYLTQVFIARRVGIRKITARADGTAWLVECSGSLRTPGRPVLRLRRTGTEPESLPLALGPGGLSASFRLPMAGGRARLELDVVDGATAHPACRWILDPLAADRAITSALEEE